MNYRLHTSKTAEEYLKQLHMVLNITPNIIARIAVALSLRDPTPIELSEPDRSGMEFNRSTLTGEYDYLFKCLIAQHLGKSISDEEYFPNLFNAHLERGIRILKNEYKMAGNSEKLFRTLILMGDDS
ncbi:DNA sulfur modification protein DndE [Thermoactinomyces mirandus]|uniref:DNA sulfur modification protein DndE n=1 Tax=Thermoactinomyces mirandus TaxID=2756294 RepID=A0A7W1XU57_9BACL|nr:DNA sulfur modification protein DndE [Thermoactinomyces mirandus]MBA4603333.1 DNA sulfur modification protein DndE [Thermoactinomyces mirandus]